MEKSSLVLDAAAFNALSANGIGGWLGAILIILIDGGVLLRLSR